MVKHETHTYCQKRREPAIFQACQFHQQEHSEDYLLGKEQPNLNSIQAENLEKFHPKYSSGKKLQCSIYTV